MAKPTDLWDIVRPVDNLEVSSSISSDSQLSSPCKLPLSGYENTNDARRISQIWVSIIAVFVKVDPTS